MFSHINIIKERVSTNIRRFGKIGIEGVLYFKTANEFEEFIDERMDSDIVLVVMAMATFVRLHQEDTYTSNDELVITEVYRSEEERKKIYPEGNTLHDVVGAHERWEAVDFRSWSINSITTEAILRFFSQTNLPNFKGLLIRHKVKGNVMHFHLQKAKN